MPRPPYPCLRIRQSPDREIFLFALPVRDLLAIADLDRVRRRAGELHGYQREALRQHVGDIAEYVGSSDVLFPHGLLLALDARAYFEAALGGDAGATVQGHLMLPSGCRARIVDGQQRLLALQAAGRADFPVPVSAFVPRDLADEREQFVRLNSARALPRRLLHELLPMLPDTLPARLERKRIPSLLVDRLNAERTSPLRGLIRRASSGGPSRTGPFVTDTSLLATIEYSLYHPRGAFFSIPLGDMERVDAEILPALLAYWHAVKAVFSDAWGRHPRESRLMHSAGVRAMGGLFDHAHRRVTGEADFYEAFVATLAPLRAQCAWTEGSWSLLGGIPWNAIQNTPAHVGALTRLLVHHLYDPQ